MTETATPHAARLSPHNRRRTDAVRAKVRWPPLGIGTGYGAPLARRAMAPAAVTDRCVGVSGWRAGVVWPGCPRFRFPDSPGRPGQHWRRHPLCGERRDLSSRTRVSDQTVMWPTVSKKMTSTSVAVVELGRSRPG